MLLLLCALCNVLDDSYHDITQDNQKQSYDGSGKSFFPFFIHTFICATKRHKHTRDEETDGGHRPDKKGRWQKNVLNKLLGRVLSVCILSDLECFVDLEFARSIADTVVAYLYPRIWWSLGVGNCHS